MTDRQTAPIHMKSYLPSQTFSAAGDNKIICLKYDLLYIQHVAKDQQTHNIYTQDNTRLTFSITYHGQI